MITLQDQDLINLEREVCSESLRLYMEAAWHLVEPAAPFKGNYHHDAICDHLEAVTRREIMRLVINVPPGSTKSILCSVMWPTWTWTHLPEEKWITSSYAEHIVRRDALRARQLLESKWYRDRWGDKWRKRAEQWTSLDYRNTAGGFRYGATVGGAVTGEHGSAQLVDDPVKPLDARNRTIDTSKLAVCREWWDETMATRVADPARGVRVIIMQRLHESDLAAHALDSGVYTHLNLPMRYEPKCVVTMPHRCSLQETDRGTKLPATELGFKDNREEGELLWPERFSEDVLKVREEELGSRATAAQDQQRPTPAGGSIYDREKLQFWRAQPKGPSVVKIQSWDCAFKGLADSDWVVGQVWARRGGEFFLLDQVRGKMSFSQTLHAIAALSAKWPQARAKLIEDKANGPAVINFLKKKIPGLIAVNPEGGKVARAQAVEPLWDAGNVWIPDPSLAAWVNDFIEEWANFNGDPGRTDDQVDAHSQALIYLNSTSISSYMASLRGVHV